MITLLTVVIFITYIGLGLPDSSIGASWPAVFVDLGVDVGYQSVVTVVITIGTLISSFLSGIMIRKFGTYLVASVSTLLTAIALFGFSISPSVTWIIFVAFPLGFGAGAIDVALNDYAAVRFSALKMSLLHCFYGVGITITPYVFSIILKDVSDWRTGFFTLFIIQTAIAFITFASLPLWKKANKSLPIEEQITPKPMGFKNMIKSPKIRTAWALFFCTCALEFLFGSWGCTFLVKQKGLTESMGAFWISLYYIGITVGRFLSGIVSKKLSCGHLLVLGYLFIAIGIIITFLPVPAGICGLAMFFVGLGNGPTFPNLTHATPYIYGKEFSGSLIGSQMVASCLGILILPSICGIVFQSSAFWAFPILAVSVFLVMALVTTRYQTLLKKEDNSFFKII